MTVYVLEWGRGFREKWMGLAGYPKGQTERLQVDSTPDGAGRFPLDVVPHGEESLSHWTPTGRCRQALWREGALGPA